MQPKTKIIAFVDILGFTAMVEEAEAAGGDFSRMIELAQALGTTKDVERFRLHGPTACPQSRYVDRDLDFRLTQISDCVVVSSEISPAGVINLIHHCFGIAVQLLAKNALCRGFITIGTIHHDDWQFIGTGYMQALKREREVAFLRAVPDEVGTPFIQIDDSVVSYVRDQTDSCVRELFKRATRSDGNYTAIYPFEAMAKLPSAFIGPDFDPLNFREKVRRSIGFRQRDLAALNEAEDAAKTERDKAKVRHYKRGLEEIIEHLRKKETLVKSMIDNRKIPFGTIIK